MTTFNVKVTLQGIQLLQQCSNVYHSFLCSFYVTAVLTACATTAVISKAKHKAPSNLQSLACVLPRASSLMGLVAHSPHHVSSYSMFNVWMRDSFNVADMIIILTIYGVQ